MAQAGEHLDLVGLDLLARAAAVALLAAAQVGVDRAPGRARGPAGRPVTIATSAGPCDSPGGDEPEGHARSVWRPAAVSVRGDEVLAVGDRDRLGAAAHAQLVENPLDVLAAGLAG